MTRIAPAAALDVLARFQPGDDERAADAVARVHRLLTSGATPFARDRYEPGHVTASAVVLSLDDRVLLVHHPRLSRWLQPGGHVEPEDVSLVAAARREVAEEAGIELPGEPGPPLVRVDVHPIPAGAGEPAHWHHDFMFGWRWSGPAPQRAGTHRVAWVPLNALETYELDDALLRGLERAARLLPT